MSKVVKKITHSTIGKIALAGGASLLAPGLGTALSGGLGLGLGTAGATALGGGVLGAGTGALTGHGLKGALTGGALGGAGGYVAGGGLSGLFGGGSGNTVSSGLGNALKNGSPDDVLGAIGKAPVGGGGLGSALSGLAGGGGSSYSSLLSPLASTGLGSYSNSKATEQLTAAQQKALGLYNGIANEQWTPGDLAASPGYQFQLDQGTQALQRQNAATGNTYSGAALKDATQYAQGLADQTASQQYAQWAQTQGQKLAALSQQAGLTSDIGAAKATGTLNQGQLLGQGVSGALGALTGNYYNSTNGTFYNPNNGGFDLASLIAKMRGQGALG